MSRRVGGGEGLRKLEGDAKPPHHAKARSPPPWEGGELRNHKIENLQSSLGSGIQAKLRGPLLPSWPASRWDFGRLIFQPILDLLEYPSGGLEDYAVFEAENADAVVPQKCVATVVLFAGRGCLVAFPIQLHGQPGSRTVEIEDVASEGKLTPELPSAQLRSGEMSPQASLRGCELLAQAAGPRPGVGGAGGWVGHREGRGSVL